MICSKTRSIEETNDWLVVRNTDLQIKEVNDKVADELLSAAEELESEVAPLYARNPDSGTVHILASPEDFGGRGVKTSICLRVCPPDFCFSDSCEDERRICRDCVRKVCKVAGAT